MRWRWYGAAALVVLAAVVVALLAKPWESAPTAMQVVVSPHPDDELQGWARIADGEDLFTVFVVMTGGESTGNCNGAPNLQEAWGERAPEPLPEPGDQGSARCTEARIDSWHHFLDLTADAVHGDELAEMGSVGLQTETGPARAWLGERSVRVAVDGGDGDLTPAKVERAVRDVLDARGGALPDLPVERIVATAYHNDSPTRGDNRAEEGCREAPCEGDSRDLEYEHPDHAAVNAAVTALAPVAGEGAWLVTHPHDPQAETRLALSREEYEHLMGLGERAGPERDSYERLGAHQVSYGWLSFPGSYWPTGRTATARNDVLFPRVQFFRHLEGTR